MAAAPGLDTALPHPYDSAARRALATAKSASPAQRRIVEVEDALADSGLARSARVALSEERETLLARNLGEWEPVVCAMAHDRGSLRGSPLIGVRFAHGFAEHVDIRMLDPVELDPLAQTGACSLKLSFVDPATLERLRTSPLLPRLRRLHLHCTTGLDPELVLALLRAPGLPPLEFLGLDNLPITPALDEAIAGLTELRGLNLQASPGLTPTTLARFTELRSLVLAGPELDVKWLTKALAASFVPQLRKLSLRGLKLGAKGCKLLGAAELKALRSLDLGECNIGQYGVELVASPHLAALETLFLDATKIGAKHLPALLDRLDLPSLRGLDLSGLRGKEAGAEALAKTDALARCGVTALGFAGNAIGDDGAELLAGAEGLAGIRRLSLAGNGLRVDGVAALADSPLLRGLEALDIRYNKIQTKGAQALAKSVAAATLVEIDVDHNWIGSKGATALFGGAGLRAIELVRLGVENNFGDAAVDALAGSDLRPRAVYAASHASPESVARLLASPAAERLGALQVYANPGDEVVDGLASGTLGPSLHTAYIGTQGLDPARVEAFDRRFPCAVQRFPGWGILA